MKRKLMKIAVLLSLLASPVFATTVTRMNLEQLVHDADLIVQGEVQSVYSQWDDERHLVFTYISIKVNEPLKGERRPVVLIRQLGGTVGGIQMSVAGAPQFTSGGAAIVFLKRQEDGSFHVVGMSQGVYEIREDSAISNVLGVDLLDVKTGEITTPLIGGRLPLEQLKSRIRELSR